MDSEHKMLTGNYAAAYGVKLAKVKVVPIYPITPQTTIIEKLIDFIAKGEMPAEYIPVESEHSAMAAAIGAQATGVRAFTASSSQGIAYMHENLWVASGLRLPLVMAMVNRTMNPPVAGEADLSDSLSQRDTGWIQIYVENTQEILDMMLQAYKIAEDKSVMLPVAICYEGMVISHFLEATQVPSQEMVDTFLPPYQPTTVLDTKNPMHLYIASDDYLLEYRYQQQEAMENAKTVIEKTDKEFKKVFGREHGGLVTSYMMEDAEVAIVTMGNISAVARLAAKALREEGIKAGVCKMRVFRPFPKEALQKALRGVKLALMLDRAPSIGSAGVVYPELKSALCEDNSQTYLQDCIAGLCGRAVSAERLIALVKESIQDYEKQTIKPIQWVDVRGLS